VKVPHWRCPLVRKARSPTRGSPLENRGVCSVKCDTGDESAAIRASEQCLERLPIEPTCLSQRSGAQASGAPNALVSQNSNREGFQPPGTYFWRVKTKPPLERAAESSGEDSVASYKGVRVPDSTGHLFNGNREVTSNVETRGPNSFPQVTVSRKPSPSVPAPPGSQLPRPNVASRMPNLVHQTLLSLFQETSFKSPPRAPVNPGNKSGIAAWVPRSRHLRIFFGFFGRRLLE